MHTETKKYELQYGNNFFVLIVYTKDIIDDKIWMELTTYLGIELKRVMDGETCFICLPSEFIDKVEVIDKTHQYSMWLLFNNIMENSGKDISIGKNNNEEQQTKSPYPPPNKKYEKI